MGYIRKCLFICIALSFLIGCVAHTTYSLPENIDTSFRTLADTIHFYDYLIDLEETSLSQYDASSDVNEGDALRHFSKTKRINSSSSTKSGSTLFKRNSIPNTSSVLFDSKQRFYSGLGEGRKRLINFGILII